MALTRYTIDGYGQVELNNCAFTEIEAQCGLATTFVGSTPCENGMLVAVDKVAGIVKLAGASEKNPVGLVYSEEKIYDERNPGLKNFCNRYNANGYFYPRVGYLVKGNVITTNCVAYDSTTYSTEADFDTALAGVGTTALYATYGTTGAWIVSASAPAGFGAKVIKATTMPDGSWGLKLVVLNGGN